MVAILTDRAGQRARGRDPARGGPGKQDAIDYAMEEIKQDNRRVHIIADFKMKILQRYSFDSTTHEYLVKHQNVLDAS